MEGKESVRLPGLETLFGIRKEDPLSNLQLLAANDLARSRSNPAPALRSSLDSTPTPSLASSSRSDPFAFSLNNSDNLSVRSWGATSSSEYDEPRSMQSREPDDPAAPAPRLSPLPWSPMNASSPKPQRVHRLSSSKHRSARISRNLDTLSAMRGYSEIGPPSAPPRSSSLQSVSSFPNLHHEAERSAAMDEDPRRSYNMALLEESLLAKAAARQTSPGEPSPPSERGDAASYLAVESGSETASIRSTKSHSHEYDVPDVLPWRYQRHGRASFSSHTSESSSLHSNVSTAPTSVRLHEEAPPSSFGARGRRSIEMAAELPPSHLEARFVEHPLANVLPAVNEAPMRMSPDGEGPIPPSPTTPTANAPTPGGSSLSGASSLRYPCPHCYKRFSRPSSLRIHVFSHTGEKPFVCTVCGRGFSVSSNLRRHYRIHANTTNVAPESYNDNDSESEEAEMDTRG